MRYFDSHAHYWDDRFSENGESADALIGALLSGSVSGIVNVGTSPETSRIAIKQAMAHKGMYAAVGIHPSDTRFLSSLDREIGEIESLIRENPHKVVALGEIGLDYHYENTDKERQMRYFEAQLTLSEELCMPVVIHDREAHADIFSAICAHPRARGIIHSYSGSAEMAKELARRGWMISFSGTVSFKNAGKLAEAARAVPAELLLIETDAPYLTPHPHRGKRNDSGYLLYTCAALAERRGISPEECAAQTEQNAKRIFGITGE